MYSFIYNPLTRKNELLKSNNGIKILNNYLSFIQNGGAAAESSQNYSDKRLLLDSVSDSVKRISAKRTANKSHYIPQQGTSIEQTWEYIKMTKKQIKKTRDEYKKQYRTIEINLNLANSLLDQGGEGACSFVGFLNMSIISGNKDKVVKAASNSKWTGQWRKVQRYLDTDYGSPDIASTLDAMKKVKILNDTDLIYVPIRSAGAREQNFNISFWVSPKQILSKYEISQKDYNSAPFIYQNMFLLENLIDRNIAVAVNALEHTRTLIGYSSDKFIFADNWGHSSMSRDVDVSKAYAQLNDNFKAGYSTVNKWAIATNIRDLAYWN